MAKKKNWRNWKSVEISGNRDYPKYGIVEIDQNTQKSPGDLRRLAVTQTL